MLPTGSRCSPEAWASICRKGTRACLVPGTYVSSVSSSDSSPSSRSDMTARAVNVFVTEPIMNCVSSVAGAGRPVARGGPTPTCADQTSAPVAHDADADAGRAPRPLRRDDPGEQVALEPGRQRGVRGRRPPAARSLRRPQAHRAVDDGVVLTQRDRLDTGVEQLAPRLAEVALGVALGREARWSSGPPPPSGCRGRRGTARTSQRSCRHPSCRLV